MTFEPARPRYTLPFAGKEYELLGTFGLIEAVEHAMKDHVGRVAVKVVDGMTITDLARLASAILTANGHALSPQEVGERLVGAVGLMGEANNTLRLHLYAFLSICLAPPGKREGKAREMGELMGRLAASPGGSTAASASAPSAGGLMTSGPPTPGA